MLPTSPLIHALNAIKRQNNLIDNFKSEQIYEKKTNFNDFRSRYLEIETM